MPTRRIPALAACAATAALLAGCASGGSGNAGGTTSSSAPSVPSGAASTDTPGSGSATLTSDQRLRPGVRYRSPADFQPGFSFEVPGADWYPYLRGGGAMNLREATDPNDQDPRNIEIGEDEGGAAQIVRQLLSNPALAAGQRHSITIGGHPGQWFDVQVRRSASLTKPASLNGEQVDAAHPIRIYVVSNGASTLTFLVGAPKPKLAAFEPDAAALIATVQLG